MGRKEGKTDSGCADGRQQGSRAMSNMRIVGCFSWLSYGVSRFLFSTSQGDNQADEDKEEDDSKSYCDRYENDDTNREI